MAHVQMVAKHGVRFRCVAGPCVRPPTVARCHVNNLWAPIFIVEAVGVAKGLEDVGGAFNRSEMHEWMTHNRVCRALRDL